MGSHSVVEESDTTMGTDSVDYTKVFNEQFPFYLSIGMTYDQYWYGENELPQFYRKAYDEKRRQENIAQHRLGLYMRKAIITSLSDEMEYPELPLPMNEKEAKEQEEYIRKKEFYKLLDIMNAQSDNAENG